MWRCRLVHTACNRVVSYGSVAFSSYRCRRCRCRRPGRSRTRRGGKKVTILEVRDRCGRRIFPLSEAQFGYPAESGAEFVHGEAPIAEPCCARRDLNCYRYKGTHNGPQMTGNSRREDRQIPCGPLPPGIAGMEGRLNRRRLSQEAFCAESRSGAGGLIGHMISSPAEPIRTRRPARAMYNQCSQALAVPRSSFPARRFTAEATRALSRRRWRADWRSRELFWQVINPQCPASGPSRSWPPMSAFRGRVDQVRVGRQKSPFDPMQTRMARPTLSVPASCGDERAFDDLLSRQGRNALSFCNRRRTSERTCAATN